MINEGTNPKVGDRVRPLIGPHAHEPATIRMKCVRSAGRPKKMY